VRHVKENADASPDLIAGRVADWAPLPGDPHELERRNEAALARCPRGFRHPVIPVEEVDEIRIVQAWIAANDPPRLELPADDLHDWVTSVTSADTTAPIAV
jgi:hypothetical protein